MRRAFDDEYGLGEAPEPVERPPKTRRARRGLSPSRRKLVEKYLPIARRAARPFKKCKNGFWEDVQSVASLALVEAANAYDPGRGVGFAAYAKCRVAGAVRDLLREQILLGRRRQSSLAPKVLSLTMIELESGRSRPLKETPVGHELESSETVEGWLAALPPKSAEICRYMYFEELNQREAAILLGCSTTQAWRLHNKSLSKLRRLAEVRERAAEVCRGPGSFGPRDLDEAPADAPEAAGSGEVEAGDPSLTGPGELTETSAEVPVATRYDADDDSDLDELD